METDARQYNRNHRQPIFKLPRGLVEQADTGRLAHLRQMARTMADDLSAEERRAQSHAEISPIVWHIGHLFMVENYWLAERVFGDTRVTDEWRAVYFPADCPKTERRAVVPPFDELKRWTIDVAAINDDYWQRAQSVSHPLLTDGYLRAFIEQHYAQHLETMRLAHFQLGVWPGNGFVDGVRPQPPAPGRVEIASTVARIGNDAVTAYDNEQPSHDLALPAFAVAETPVTNAEWLGFIRAGGYDNSALWSADGWTWRQAHQIRHPQHWRSDDNDDMQIPETHDGDISTAPVHGISWYEAEAFARYAGARLPSEAEWETARRSDVLARSGDVWEWCADVFRPYPGFQAFPYDGYSRRWFDGQHVVARGGCRLSEPEIKRPAFRNFYPPTHRHVFAGLRLAWH